MNFIVGGKNRQLEDLIHHILKKMTKTGQMNSDLKVCIFLCGYKESLT